MALKTRAMRDNNTKPQEQGDLLAPFREEPIHTFVRDKVLREQLGVILAILGFIDRKSVV